MCVCVCVWIKNVYFLFYPIKIKQLKIIKNESLFLVEKFHVLI